MLRRALVLAAAAALSAPSGAGASALVRVRLDRGPADAATLARLGLDAGHAGRSGSATVVVGDPRVLRRAGLRIRVLAGDLEARRRRLRAREAAAPGPSGLPSGRTTYRTLEDFGADLDRLAAAAPGTVRPLELGRSVEGRPLRGVEIARDVARTDDGRPVFVVLGLHHAREWPSGEVPAEFALDLVRRGLAGEPRWSRLLAGARTVVVPVVNPDGFAVSRSGVQPDRRKSCAPLDAAEAALPCAMRSGVDLNRNFGAQWGGAGASTVPADDVFRGPGPWSEPETRAIHELTRRLQVTGLQTVHNVAGLVLREPGVRSLGELPDEPRLKALGDAMAAAAGYRSQHGFELYDVTGATEDWNSLAQGTFGFTIELGPDDSDFQGPFGTHVVDQYLGRAGTPSAGRGVREALLLAGEEAMSSADHALLRGTAIPGALLRLRRDFRTATSPVCAATVPGTADCLDAGPVRLLDDGIATSLTVPAGGRFRWDVGPSTRPLERRAGRTEAWTLSCEAGGRVLASTPVVVGRGQTATVDACTPGAAAGVTSTASGAPAVPGDRPVAPRLTLRLAAVHRDRALARGALRPWVRATAARRVALRARLGGVTVARGSVEVPAGGDVRARMALTRAGRRALGGRGALGREVVLRAAAEDAAVVTLRVPVRP